MLLLLSIPFLFHSVGTPLSRMQRLIGQEERETSSENPTCVWPFCPRRAGLLWLPSSRQSERVGLRSRRQPPMNSLHYIYLPSLTHNVSCICVYPHGLTHGSGITHLQHPELRGGAGDIASLALPGSSQATPEVRAERNPLLLIVEKHM